VAFVALGIAAGHADAQIIQRPERPITGIFGGGRPPDPSRIRQDLSLSISSLGGYDRSLTPADSGGAETFLTREPGYTGFADAGLNYRRSGQVQLLELATRTFVNAFRNAGLTPVFGGDVHARLVAPLGRRVELELSENARLEPYYTFRAFAPAPGAVIIDPPAQTNSTSAFTRRQSLATDTAVALRRRWRRSSLGGSYLYSQRDFRDNIGDSQRHGASLDYSITLGRGSSIRASYRRSKSDYVTWEGKVQPVDDHSADLGFEHEHRISRTRQWAFSFGSGATYVDTLNSVSREPLRYTTPSYYARTRLDLGRTWAVWADYRRGIAVIEGLTPQTFVTNNGTLRLGGYIGSRTEIAVSAAYSDGARSFVDTVGTFDNYAGTLQIRQMLTRFWSVVINQNFYRHTLRDIANLPPGFPERLDRNTVQVGMTFDLPLYGAYARQRRQPPSGAN
jgi:hypothetical protein